MVGAFQPVHLPRRAHGGENILHQVAPAQRVARAVEAEHGNLDLRQMSIPELLRLAGWMERIGEQKQRIARHAIGGEHGCGSPAHRAPADDEAAGSELLAGARDDGTEALLQAWHRVGPAGAFFPVEEVESDEVEASGTQRCRQANHAAVFPMTAGTVSADENRLPVPRRAGLENRGGFLLIDCNTPANTWFHVASCVYILSAARRNSSSTAPTRCYRWGPERPAHGRPPPAGRARTRCGGEQGSAPSQSSLQGL